jgi:hydrogenase/urease accessory protein HupE
MRVLSLATLLFGACLLMPGRALAHDLQPPFIELRQAEETRFILSWSDTGYGRGEDPLVMPSSCVVDAVARQAGSLHMREYLCAGNPVTEPLQVALRSGDPSIPTIAVYRPLHGSAVQSVLGPADEAWLIDPVGKTATRFQYLTLGIMHILTGYDHLAVVGCLVLLALGLRRIFATVTGFTIGHSLTLAWVSLCSVDVPSALVEACIALSVVLLASEVLTPERQSVTKRWPTVVSALFGLLHGLGFASFLTEVGLPREAKLLSLLCFNLGVELGQVLVVVLLIGYLHWVARAPGRSLEGASWRRWFMPRPAIGMAAGCLGAYLVIDTVLPMMGIAA